MQAEFTIIKGTVKTKEHKTQSKQTDSISIHRNITTANNLDWNTSASKRLPSAVYLQQSELKSQGGKATI